MRPNVESSCKIAPKLLSARSFVARSPLPAACITANVLSHDKAPPALERWRRVAFEGSRSSARQAQAAILASSMLMSSVSLFASSCGEKSSSRSCVNWCLRRCLA
eukprot:6172629-Pleurochrysis_carterae.AAC.2